MHAASGFYDVPGFLAGKDPLRAFEPGEVGDVRGKTGPGPHHELASPEQARRAWEDDGWPDITIDVALYAMDAFAASAGTIISAIKQQIGLARSLLSRRPNSFADWLAGNLTAFTPAPAPTDS